MVEQQQNLAQKGVDNVMAGLVELAGSYGQAQDAKEKFMGTYNFLQEKKLMSPELDEKVQSLVDRGKYGAASATIAPYLAELDFGRKAMLSGRSGFFDSSGQWQMAMPAQEVQPRNKYGYRVGGGR
jgi:hypothetical protein